MSLLFKNKSTFVFEIILASFCFVYNSNAQMLDLLDDMDETTESTEEKTTKKDDFDDDFLGAPQSNKVNVLEEKDEVENNAVTSTPVKKDVPKIGAFPGAPKIADNASDKALPGIGATSEVRKNIQKNQQKAAMKNEGLSLFDIRNKSKKGHLKTKAENFDIAGIKLKMTPEEVIEAIAEYNFKLVRVKNHIPELHQWRIKQDCLKERANAPYRIRKYCLHEIAKEQEVEFVEAMLFEKKYNKEKIIVEFTSATTGNKCYHIRYIAKGDHSLGVTKEGVYLKNKRRQEFLEQLISKYGEPTDADTMTWGEIGFGAALVADITDTFLDASVDLVDTSIDDDDFDEIMKESKNFDKYNEFSF
ncbi:MAG: hypothetical protein MJ247_03645 [Alphaproteobacteria bacterium]|nr:hypothetical protein [Alphaproteobacteria bacterium]